MPASSIHRNDWSLLVLLLLFVMDQMQWTPVPNVLVLQCQDCDVCFCFLLFLQHGFTATQLDHSTAVCAKNYASCPAKLYVCLWISYFTLLLDVNSYVCVCTDYRLLCLSESQKLSAECQIATDDEVGTC